MEHLFEAVTDKKLKYLLSHFTFSKAGLVGSRKRTREGETAALMNPPPPEKLLSSFSMLPGDLAGEIKRQRDDLDRFLQTQGEELRRRLAADRENSYIELLCTTEELVGQRMREKQAELEKAMRHHAELESRAAQLTREAQKWQVRATTSEAKVSSLQAHIHQAISSRSMVVKPSMIGVNKEEVEDTESAYVDPSRIELIGPSCRICRRKSATVMALPCRHLVLCKVCDGTMRVCPICLNVKNSSIEISFS